MTAYYNEFDPFAAAWLRNLIEWGVITEGIVDERSIEDVRPSDLEGFTQCHFFAGIGAWSYALRRAGWSDDRPVWTGSCPCQPFSAAGKGKGFTDERHLWPAFFHLIQSVRPVTVFGEQVASKDGLAWLDLVHDDLEGEGYAVGSVDSCAAGFGAPHIRQRLYWVADSGGQPGEWNTRSLLGTQKESDSQRKLNGCLSIGYKYGGATDGMADSAMRGCESESNTRPAGLQRTAIQPREIRIEPCGLHPAFSELADSIGKGLERKPRNGSGTEGREDAARPSAEDSGPVRTSPTNVFWSNPDWIFCRDGRWRPVESGTSPLAHGASARVGRLRGYGNAIVAPQAQAFIEAYMEVKHARTYRNV